MGLEKGPVGLNTRLTLQGEPMTKDFQLEDRIPEPWFADIPGSKWDESALRGMSDLLQQQLMPRWRRQVLAKRTMADRVDDILQEFTVEIYSSLIPRYKPHTGGTRLVGYLCKYFSWRLQDAVRSMQRRLDRELEPVDEARDLADVVYIDAGRQALYIAAKDALSKLPERLRRVTELRIERIPFADIARELGIKEGHARTLAFKARKDLKDLLQEGEADV